MALTPDIILEDHLCSAKRVANKFEFMCNMYPETVEELTKTAEMTFNCSPEKAEKFFTDLRSYLDIIRDISDDLARTIRATEEELNTYEEEKKNRKTVKM